MSTKLFELENLWKFEKNTFLIFRNELGEELFEYKDLFKVIEFLHCQFKKLAIISSCFCINLKEGHTFDSLALVISLLNYGCHFCPVSSEASSDFLENCGATYFVSNNLLVDEKFNTISCIAEFKVYKENFKFYIVNKKKTLQWPENMCYTMTTTGTTGIPKMVHVPYNCIALNISSLCKIFELNNTDVIYLGTPFTFDPFVVELFMALKIGAALLLTPSTVRLNTQSLVNFLWPDEASFPSVTVLQMTPSNFRQFGLDTLRNKIFSIDSNLRILILGGEEFPKRHELLKWLPPTCLKTNVRIFNIYGITELSCWSTIYEWSQRIERDNSPLGTPIDTGTVLRIVNTIDGKEVSDVGQGELFLGSTARKTYIPQIDVSKDIGNNDLLYRSTGDLVERNQAGELYYIGRLNNVFKRMGKRICLDTIDKKLADLLAKFMNVIPVSIWNEKKQHLICCLKMDDYNFLSEMKRLILENLAEHEKPDRIIVVNMLPVNKHNKFDRKILLEHVLTSKTFEDPVDKFTRFMKEVLDFDSNEVAQKSAGRKLKRDHKTVLSSISFTAAGGSSFQALSLATDIGEDLTNPEDQRMLLKMLLDTHTKLSNIFSFLKNIKMKSFTDIASKKLYPSNFFEKKLSKVELNFKWRVFMDKCIDAAPSVDCNERYICIGSHAALLLTIDALTGEVISRFQLNGRIECQVAFASTDLALVGCDAGYLYCFNYLKGHVNWALNIANQVKAKPLIINGEFAIIGCYDTAFNLVAVSLKHQQIIWRKKIGTRPIFASPTLLGTQAALICTLDGTYEKIDVQTGVAMWTQKCDSPIFSTPSCTINESKFILAEVEGKLHICSSETGHILQTFLAGGNIFSNLRILQIDALKFFIIFGCHDHHVYCLEKISSECDTSIAIALKWKTKINAAVFATPTITEFHNDNYIIVCSIKGLLTILESLTGSIVTSHNFENELFSTPCYLRHRENKLNIYFGCRDNYFYCMQLK